VDDAVSTYLLLHNGVSPPCKGAEHDDYPNLDLNTTTDILSQLKDAPNTTQPSQGGQPRQAPDRFTLGSHAVHRKRRRVRSREM
jgi:hypothetical protein